VIELIATIGYFGLFPERKTDAQKTLMDIASFNQRSLHSFDANDALLKRIHQGFLSLSYIGKEVRLHEDFTYFFATCQKSLANVKIIGSRSQ